MARKTYTTPRELEGVEAAPKQIDKEIGVLLGDACDDANLFAQGIANYTACVT